MTGQRFLIAEVNLEGTLLWHGNEGKKLSLGEGQKVIKERMELDYREETWITMHLASKIVLGKIG